MKISAVLIVFLFFFCSCLAQEQEIENLAARFLISLSSDTAQPLTSEFISSGSLSAFKELALNRPTFSEPVMGLVSPDSLRAMSDEQFYDYIFVKGMQLTKNDRPKMPAWKITGSEIFVNPANSKDEGSVSYEVEGRGKKEMKFVKEDNKWKLVLSFNSVF